ncbi:NOG1 family protein [Methanolobus sp. ZRKC3]|uniref:NOG1 family protein n=1 Tax=Methanolobus sp. ZRKC3 TaxID=3125786 RepID=UPI003244627D
MIFEKINTVPTSDELLDKAFRRASRAMAGKTVTSRETARQGHESMILTSGNILSDNLANIVRRFPNFDDLHPFYYDLANVIVGVDNIKKSLGTIDWASSKIHDMAREHVGMIRRTREPVVIRKQFFGRMASIMGSINKDLVFLNDARNKLRELPSVHDEPTIVVAGYPNIGKSSFVSMATGATPEIASYPFTTKGVSIGHFMIGPDRYQVIDTPGLLDRPMSERNDIELQAISALTNLDAVVLFIIDASETCGYEIEDQKNMLADVKEGFELPILVVANKSDLPQFRELDFVDMKMSTATGEGLKEVVDTLVDMIEKSKSEKISDEI